MPIPNSATLPHLVPTSPNLRLRASRDGSYPAHVSPSTVDGRLGVEIGFHRKLKKIIGPYSAENFKVEALTAVWTDKDLELVNPQHTGSHVAFEVLFDANRGDLELQVHQRESRTAGNGLGADRRQQSMMTITNEGWPPNEQGQKHKVPLLYGKQLKVEVAGCAVEFHWNALLVSVNEAARGGVLRAKAIQGHSARKAAAGDNFFKIVTGSAVPNSQYANGVRVTIDEGTKELIGQGNSGTEVFKALDIASKRVIAVKTLRIFGSQAANLHVQMLREIDGYIRTSYAHPHIVQYLGYKGAHTTLPHIFMSLHDGDVSGLLRFGAFEGRDLHKDLLLQMLQALDFLAFHNLCHRDVKPNNILYTRLETGAYQFFLADLGLSKYALAGNTDAGTPFYMAPEVRYTSAPHCPKVDVWSLLVTFMEVYTEWVAFRNVQDLLPTEPETHEPVAEFVSMHREYSDMSYIDPAKRASARDMPIRLGYGGLIHVRRTGRLAGEAADLPGLQ